jgi:hypothetical protein
MELELQSSYYRFQFLPANLVELFFYINGGLILKQKIHQLIVKIWKQEKIPGEWSEGIL